MREIILGLTGISLKPEHLGEANEGLPNWLTTTQFTWTNWLPLSMYHQFKRPLNIYFLVICCFVCMPWSPLKPWGTLLPFTIVTFWTCLKDLYEDSLRREDDHRENSRESWCFNESRRRFELRKWGHIRCGDIVWVADDEGFPADMFLLFCPRTKVFISSSNLDGESSWKERRLPATTYMLRRLLSMEVQYRQPSRCMMRTSSIVAARHSNSSFFSGERSELWRHSLFSSESLDDPSVPSAEAIGVCAKLWDLEMRFRVEEPCASLWDANGSVSVPGTGDGSSLLDGDNFLPRGCVLRGTPWVIGVATYVGADTKIRLNASIAPFKTASLMKVFNYCMLFVSLLPLVFSIYSSFGGLICTGVLSATLPLKYLVLIYHVVPITLFLCLEGFQLILGSLIASDQQLVCSKTTLGAATKQCGLVAELGQITHVFSDKTGTLTENEMRLARVFVGGRDLGDFRWIDGCGMLGVGQVETMAILEGRAETGAPREAVLQLFLALALSNAVSVYVEDDGLHYSGASADEVALAQGADEVGVSLMQRRPIDDGEHVQVNVGEEEISYTQLVVIEFDSNRKRMSTIFKRSDGQIICFTKGADSVMKQLLLSPLTRDEEQHLKAYSSEGLRTLVIGHKLLTDEFLKTFRLELSKARGMDAKDPRRASKIAEVEASLECDLHLTGITAVEDRLQDGVPEALEILRATGIRFWMLTGDKMETAIAIARSCHLIDESMVLAYASEASNYEEAIKALRDAQDVLEFASKGALGAFILDGHVAGMALTTVEGRRSIYKLSNSSMVCVCARLSPQQKDRLVNVVREFDRDAVTLSIGDGANDVPMITAAHVGVGIRGKEGAHAVQASDFSFSCFRFLVPLLLCHGRPNYRRVATYLCFYIYKNIVLASADIMWAHISCFSGTKACPELLQNLLFLFTALPPVAALSADVDVPNSVALAHPELYADGHRKAWLTPRLFGYWILSGVWHGALVWYLPYAFVSRRYGDNGELCVRTPPGYEPCEDWWAGAMIGVTNIVFVTCLKFLLVSPNRLSASTWGPLISCTMGFLGTTLLAVFTGVGYYLQPELTTNVLIIVFSARGLANLVLVPLLAISADAIARTYREPSTLELLQRSSALQQQLRPLSPGFSQQDLSVQLVAEKSDMHNTFELQELGFERRRVFE